MSESPTQSRSPSPQPTWRRLHKKVASASPPARSRSPASLGTNASQSINVAKAPARHHYGTRPSTRTAHPAVAAGLVPRVRGSRAEISAAASRKAAEKAAQKERRDAEKAQRAMHVAEGVKRLAELEDRQVAEELEEECELRRIPTTPQVTRQRARDPSLRPTSRDQTPMSNITPSQHNRPLVEYQSSSSSESDDLEAAFARIRSRPKPAKRQDSGVTKQAPTQQRASKESNSDSESDADSQDERSAKHKKRNCKKQLESRKRDREQLGRDGKKRDRGTERLKINAHRRQHWSKSPTRSHLPAHSEDNDEDPTRKRKRKHQERRSPSPEGPLVPTKKARSSQLSAFRDDWQTPQQKTTTNDRTSHGSSSRSGGPASGWRNVLNLAPTSSQSTNRSRGDGSTGYDEPPAAFSDRDVITTRQYAVAAAERQSQPKIVVEVVDKDPEATHTPAKTPRQRRRSPTEMPEDQSRSATYLPDVIKPVFSTKIVPTVLDCVGSKRNPWDLQEEDRDEFLNLCQDAINMACDHGCYAFERDS
ncbi:hypothetical protein C8Q73DRAFT_787875 [Cubamyces lactineus]|nr:hypothetical protein C8Q73DRAFT_787875 [Cubamyces lactineus]